MTYQEIRWEGFFHALGDMQPGEKRLLRTPKGKVLIGRGKGDVYAAKGSTLVDGVKSNKLGLIQILYDKEYTK